MEDRQISGQVCLFEAKLCVSWQGCVLQEKGVLAAKCWLTPSRKYQKALYEVL